MAHSRPSAPPLGPAAVAAALIHVAAIYALTVGLAVERAPFGPSDNLVSISPSFGPSRLPPPDPPYPRPPVPPGPPAAIKPSRPLGPVSSWVTFEDYPTAALREGLEGTTRFRLEIGTNGKVAGCSITLSSGHTALDAAACANMTKRGKFSPATDAQGVAVPGSWSGAVRWTMPTD